MIKGLYTSASSMVATQRNLNLIANNLSNVNTDGYKKDEGIAESFPEVLMLRLEGEKRPNLLGSLGTGVQLDESYTHFTQGNFSQTDKQLDLAIAGQGFFAVQTPEGIRYTRNGNFTLNQQGQIVTQQGYPLLGERGPLQTINGREIRFAEDGQLYLGNLRGDQIRVVGFSDENLVTKVGDNLFDIGEAEEQQVVDYEIKQGYLERSNVNVVEEMVKMIEVTRLYEANQKVIQNADNTLGKAVNDVGRLG